MDLVTQQWISSSIWSSTIGWSKRLHNDRIAVGRKRKHRTHLSWNVIVKVPRVLGIMEFGTEWSRITMNIRPVNPTKERVCLQSCVKTIRYNEPPPPQFFRARLALITSAPSPTRVAPEGVMRALRLACTIMEFGRTTELEACEPKRSSDSHSNCCIRSMASCDTRGSAGKRKDCFQFKIFCRVTWR
jgi:hypothetical protein